MPHVSEKERRKKSSEEKDKGFFEFKIALIFEELAENLIGQQPFQLPQDPPSCLVSVKGAGGWWMRSAQACPYQTAGRNCSPPELHLLLGIRVSLSRLFSQ